MTLLDLWTLLKKNWWLVIGLPIVCAALCFGALTVMPAKYSASATLLASNEVGIVGSSATAVGTQLSDGTGMTVTASTNTTNKAVTVRAEGSDAEACVSMANQVAEAARDAAFEFLGQASDEEEVVAAEATSEAMTESSADAAANDEGSLYALLAAEQEKPVTIAITEAVRATDNSPSRMKYSLVALLAGLFLALCIVVIRDLAKGAIHNAEEIEENYGLRLLGPVLASNRRRSNAAAEDASLLAALDFAGEGKQALCVMSIEDTASAQRVVSAVEGVAEAAGKRIACIGETAALMPLFSPDALANAIATQTPADADLVFVLAPAVASSADFAYLAPACGCAVLVLEAMRTKRTHLESALRQLALSETEVAGFVLVSAA